MLLEVTFSLSEILVAIMTIVATGFGFIIKEQRDKIKMIQNQLSDKKYKVYHEIYAVFFDILKQQKGLSKNQKIEDVTIRMIDIKKDLFIYAPDTIVKKFLEWVTYVGDQPGNNRQMLIFLELFIMIRKDMGNEKTSIEEVDILKGVIGSNEEYKKFIQSIGKQE